MKSIINLLRRLFPEFGLVEQSQIVASTAVVVAMGTIVTTHLVTGSPFSWLDFISITTVGVIGFVSVYFSLKYGRMLDEQRRELLELNTIGEAVNHSVELDYVLQSALEKVMELMHARCGWIYLYENDRFTLEHRSGTPAAFFALSNLEGNGSHQWIFEPGMLRVNQSDVQKSTTDEFKQEDLQIVASIPLVRNGSFAGVLIIGGNDVAKFEEKKIALIQAFGNQISVALQNASLFEQLKESESLYADLYEYSPDMYHSIDRNGIVISCNLTESLILGMPKKDIVGHSVLKLYPPAQHESVRDNLRRIFDQGKELRGVEEQMQCSDGSVIDVSVNTALVYNADGQPTMARVVLRDITEKKKMEAKILQAQKIDSIGHLTGGISHDFNNILTAILGSASIMRRKVKDDNRLLKYVDLIETTCRRGAAVTRQLLTFARKSSAQIQPVDINAIIDQTLNLFEATTPKTIHVKCVLSPEPVIVEGDDGQLQQAILNLCLNARDALPNGGVLVVNCRPIELDEKHAAQIAQAKPGEYVMITVADSGVGIPPNVLNHIFEPFFTTKEQGKGTGLGLAVVYGVIRSHGGYITVNSEVNSGTIFTIYLPRVKDVHLVRSTHQDVMNLKGGTERILLIEDEISIGELGQDILTEIGYTVEIAHNGREAEHKVRTATEPFDLIILDMNMPRMGGLETFRRIKALSPSLKVLVCSGYSATMLEDGQFIQSIDGFLQKPYELTDFTNKVRAILDSSVVVAQ